MKTIIDKQNMYNSEGCARQGGSMGHRCSRTPSVKRQLPSASTRTGQANNFTRILTPPHFMPRGPHPHIPTGHISPSLHTPHPLPPTHSLLRTPEVLHGCVSSMVKAAAGRRPVSVKMRSG